MLDATRLFKFVCSDANVCLSRVFVFRFQWGTIFDWYEFHIEHNVKKSVWDLNVVEPKRWPKGFNMFGRMVIRFMVDGCLTAFRTANAPESSNTFDQNLQSIQHNQNFHPNTLPKSFHQGGYVNRKHDQIRRSKVKAKDVKRHGGNVYNFGYMKTS